MGENIAAQQIREYPLCQGTIKKWSLNRMDSISPNSPQDKICSRCNERSWDRKSKTHWCQVCRNEYARDNARKNHTLEKGRRRFLLKNYGITLEEYELILSRQAGVCACCGQSETLIHWRTNEIQPLSVDHNHETGQVRELVCNTCNKIIGFLELDRSRVEKAIKYLKKHDIWHYQN